MNNTLSVTISLRGSKDEQSKEVVQRGPDQNEEDLENLLVL